MVGNMALVWVEHGGWLLRLALTDYDFTIVRELGARLHFALLRTRYDGRECGFDLGRRIILGRHGHDGWSRDLLPAAFLAVHPSLAQVDHDGGLLCRWLGDLAVCGWRGHRPQAVRYAQNHHHRGPAVMPEHDAVQTAVEQHRALQQALSAWFSEIDDDFNGELAPIHEALLGLPSHHLAALNLVRADAQLAAWREGVEAAAQFMDQRPAEYEAELEGRGRHPTWVAIQAIRTEEAQKLGKRIRALLPPASLTPLNEMLEAERSAVRQYGYERGYHAGWFAGREDAVDAANEQDAEAVAEAILALEPPVTILPPAGTWEQGREAAEKLVIEMGRRWSNRKEKEEPEMARHFVIMADAAATLAIHLRALPPPTSPAPPPPDEVREAIVRAIEGNLGPVPSEDIQFAADAVLALFRPQP